MTPEQAAERKQLVRPKQPNEKNYPELIDRIPAYAWYPFEMEKYADHLEAKVTKLEEDYAELSKTLSSVSCERMDLEECLKVAEACLANARGVTAGPLGEHHRIAELCESFVAALAKIKEIRDGE